MDTNTITIRNRTLEQCLYNLGEQWISYGKDEEGLTVWTFERTPEAEWIIDHFKASAEKRRQERDRKNIP